MRDPNSLPNDYEEQIHAAVDGEVQPEDWERLKGQIELMKQEQQISLNRQSQLISEEMKRHIKDIEGKYSVLKEGLRSQSEDYKSDLSYEAKVYAADRAAQTAEKVAEKKAVEARKKEKKPVKSK